MMLTVAILLVLGVTAAWIAAAAFVSLPTPLAKLHVVGFVNVVALGLAVAAAFVTDGVSSRSLKCALIWLATLTTGALMTHVTGRALHLREGERR